MKKLVQSAFVVGMLFFYTHSFGQTTGSGSEKIKTGKQAETYFDLLINVVGTNVNYGKQNSGLADFKKPALGLQAGVSFQAGITPHLSLVSELYFITKGGKLKANNPLTQVEQSLRFYTFELPVMARIHIGKFHVNAGAALAYNFDGTQKIEGISTDLSFDDSATSFKRFDAGVQMGGGYTFKIKQKRATLDIRYCHGLTNISNDKEIYNRSLLVSLHISNPWNSNPLGLN